MKIKHPSAQLIYSEWLDAALKKIITTKNDKTYFGIIVRWNHYGKVPSNNTTWYLLEQTNKDKYNKTHDINLLIPIKHIEITEIERTEIF